MVLRGPCAQPLRLSSFASLHSRASASRLSSVQPRRRRSSPSRRKTGSRPSRPRGRVTKCCSSQGRTASGSSFRATAPPKRPSSSAPRMLPTSPCGICRGCSPRTSRAAQHEATAAAAAGRSRAPTIKSAASSSQAARRRRGTPRGCAPFRASPSSCATSSSARTTWG